MNKTKFMTIALVGTAFVAGFYVGFKKGQQKEIEEDINNDDFEAWDDDWKEVDDLPQDEDEKGIEPENNNKKEAEPIEEEIIEEEPDEESLLEEMVKNGGGEKVKEEKENTNKMKCNDEKSSGKVVLFRDSPCLFLNKKISLDHVDRTGIHLYDLQLNNVNDETFTLFNFCKNARIHRDPNYKGVLISCENMKEYIKETIQLTETGVEMSIEEYKRTFDTVIKKLNDENNLKEEAS